jgi:hypothetical protein
MRTDRRPQTIDYRLKTTDSRFKTGLLCLASCVLCLAYDCYAQTASVSSTELINNAKKYDGQAVVYSGEVIGDVMMRGDSAWINVNDGQNAVGIWLGKEQAQAIKFTGSYRYNGDQIEVSGVFNRNCSQHGGDMDIHAQEVRITKTGNVLGEETDVRKRNVVYILLGVIIFVVIFVPRSKSS